MTDHSPEPSRMAVPEIWGNVPQRNRNFTGREGLLEELRGRAYASDRPGVSATAIVPQALYGLGGVGKTQLAIEYAYRYAGDYQLVWWIPAEQIPLVRSTLAALAPRLGITGIPPNRVEDLVAAVHDALRRGQPYERWLLIFDNADQPELIREYMPPGPGHVLVTSRNRGWQRHVEALQVDVFRREESLAYLQRRVEGIEPADAVLLADELGDLPLALEQAAALLAETALTVSAYLDLLARESDRVLGESTPRRLPGPGSGRMEPVGRATPGGDALCHAVASALRVLRPGSYLSGTAGPRPVRARPAPAGHSPRRHPEGPRNQGARPLFTSED